jgi:general secretion pathway protein G
MLFGEGTAGATQDVSRMNEGFRMRWIQNSVPDGRAFSRAGGFTLLELLVVLVILGLLASFVGPRYFDQLGRSNAKVARAQIDALEKALEHYRLDTGRYPTTEQGLAALTERPTDEGRWAGPYLKKQVPADPWGHPYAYRAGAGPQGFEIQSLGADGKPGGEGENADIRSQ